MEIPEYRSSTWCSSPAESKEVPYNQQKPGV